MSDKAAGRGGNEHGFDTFRDDTGVEIGVKKHNARAGTVELFNFYTQLQERGIEAGIVSAPSFYGDARRVSYMSGPTPAPHNIKVYLEEVKS